MNKRNIRKWVTYILNMLLFVPFAGGLSILICHFFEGGFRLFFSAYNLPLWAKIIFPSLMLVPFMVLWGIYQYKSSKNYWNSARLLLLTLYTWFSCNFFGVIKAGNQFVILQSEHHYFWTLFEKALAKYTDFQTAVDSMLTSEIHEDVMCYIGFSVCPYIGTGKVLLCVGGVVLLLSWLMMLSLQKRKYRTWVVVVSLTVGLALLGYGIYNYTFGRVVEARLELLFHQQKSLVLKMKKITPPVSNDAIILIIKEQCVEWNGFGDSYHRLIEKLEGKKGE